MSGAWLANSKLKDHVGTELVAIGKGEIELM